MQDWIALLSPVTILVAAWWASHNAVEAIKTSREVNQQSIANAESIARKKNAVDMIMRTQSDSRIETAYGKVRQMFGDGHDISSYAYPNKINENDQFKSSDLRYLLNHFEHVANGINQGIFDEETIKRSQFSTIVNLHRYSLPYITAIRTKHSRPTVYMELETIVTKWNRDPLQKI